VANVRQAKGGPGIDAQRLKVARMCRQLERGDGGPEVVGEFVVIESRPYYRQVVRAIEAARKRGAYVVVAQLYQLARDAGLLAWLAREDDAARALRLAAEQRGTPWAGLQGFLFPDLPTPNTPVRMLAELARFEREAIGRPAREGLAAAKASGAKLGGARPGTLRENARTRAAAIDRAEQLRPLLAPMAAQGASLREMAQKLAAAGTTTAKGNPLSPTQIKRHLGSLGLLAG
jgi:DNA invertase Pin-like site-specific DNA recombinase